MMKKLILPLLVGSALAGCATKSLKVAVLQPFGGPVCRHGSWNPEVYSFYGERDKIVDKLGYSPARLTDRRVFVTVTRGDANAKGEVKFYERQTEWQIS